MIRINDLGVLADDLTGASDVAADTACVRGDQLAVINTQSRRLSVPESKEVLQRAGQLVAEKLVIFVKIDAALRGPVGAELEGLLAALGSREVVVAPAIPSIGRTTCGGFQYDAGIPIDKTDYASDPVWPIHSASISELLSQTGTAECRVRDAVTQEDLCRIVEQSLADERVVLVGSLGLADALAEYVKGNNQEPESRTALCPARRALIVSGSWYERTQQQIKEALLQPGVWLIDVLPEGEMSTGWLWPRSEGAVIVRLVPGPAQAFRSTPDEVLLRFARAVMQLIERLEPDGLGIIGGDTAFELLRQLQVQCVSIHGRLSGVIAYGAMCDGAMRGRPLATKGGSVGPIDAVTQMIDYLRHVEPTAAA